MKLNLHSDMQIKALTIGEEKAPLLVIDNFLDNADLLVEDAASSTFLLEDGFYPGIRTQAPLAYQELILQTLEKKLLHSFNIDAAALYFSVCHYSIVTIIPAQLKLLQRIPHFDSPKKDSLAAVHYLFKEDLGGTSFYRHRKTGYETIDEERKIAYYTSLESENDGPNMPKSAAGYINGDTALYERIEKIPAVFNRLIIYRRNSLHSGSIPQNIVASDDPRKGRLTISSFIDCAP